MSMSAQAAPILGAPPEERWIEKSIQEEARQPTIEAQRFRSPFDVSRFAPDRLYVVDASLRILDR